MAIPTANSSSLSFPLLILILMIINPFASIFVNGANSDDPQWAKLAIKPPMGWMSWARFTCKDIDESLYVETGNRLVSDGYKELGYDSVHVDDCWNDIERTREGELRANTSLFKNGIAWLADKMHENGLKFGLYADCGLKTCAGYPGLLKSSSDLEDNYFELDAKMFANVFKIDSLKMDGCYVDPIAAESVCYKMCPALKGTGRDISLSCEWPFYMMYAHGNVNWSRVVENCHTWRYYDDIEVDWSNIVNLIDYTVKHQSTFVKYHGPGHWFDPDQLVIGNGGLSRNQEEAQMAVWSFWSAPLIMSNNLTEIEPISAQILKNKKMISIDQDELGVLALMVKSTLTDEGDILAFVKPVAPVTRSCPSFAVLYLNRRDIGNSRKVSFKLVDLLKLAPLSVGLEHQIELEKMGLSSLNETNRIDPIKCFDKIESKELKYKVEDLSRENEEDFVLKTSQMLELLVEPNGIRAVKLTELN